jgi:hypothetical protein
VAAASAGDGAVAGAVVGSAQVVAPASSVKAANTSRHRMIVFSFCEAPRPRRFSLGVMAWYIPAIP